MKFKFSVLALLVVGLVIGLSGSAFATVTISLNDANSIADADVEVLTTGIPAAVLTVANDSTAAVSITGLSLDTVAAEFNAVGDFQYGVWLDADENGIVSQGDTELKAAADMGANAGTEFVSTLTTPLAVPAESSVDVIIVVDVVTGAAAEAITIGTGATAANNVSAGTFFALDATAGKEPDADTGTVATITVVAAAAGQSMDITAAAIAVAGSNIPNKAVDQELINFTLTSDTNASTLTEITLIEGTAPYASTNGQTIDTSVSNIKLFIDNGTVGTLDDADIQIPLNASAFAADPTTFVLTSGVYAAAGDAVTFLVTGDLTGLNADGDVIAVDLDVSASVAGNEAIQGVDEVGPAIDLDALTAVASTKDITGLTGRPNGYLDAIRLDFKVGGVAKSINDATFDNADWTIDPGANTAFTTLAKNATYYGDSANNSYIYVQHSEGPFGEIDGGVPANSVATNGTPSAVYDGTTQIVSSDGLYALPAQTLANATDTAPPVPLSVTTLDTDGNGKLDQIAIQFSEDIANGGVATGVGLLVPGYEVAAAATAAGNGFVASLWEVDLTEDEYDTGAVPAVEYLASAGELDDGITSLVASWTASAVPVTDGAAPTLVKTETKDNSGNGGFDALELTFSEPVQLDPADVTLTVADLVGAVDGFEFDDTSGHDAIYAFPEAGHTGLGTDVITLAVTEIGSMDTAVMPVIEYNNAAAVIVDMAATPIPLAAQAAFTPVYTEAAVVSAATVLLVDGISPRILSAETVDADGDGKLDGMNMSFSEAMGTTSDNYLNLVIGDHEVTSASVLGSDVSVVFSETGYDTGDLPVVTYDSLSIVDANDAKLAAIAAGDVSVKDAAAPVVWKTSTVDADKDGQIDALDVHFTEYIDSNSVTTGLQGFSIGGTSGHVADAAGDTELNSDHMSVRVPITESGTLDTEVLVDVNYAPGVVTDRAVAPIPLAVVGDDATRCTDGAAPVVTAVSTVDSDYDGFVDGVTFVFNEVITTPDSAKAAYGIETYDINVNFQSWNSRWDPAPNPGVTITGSGDTWTFVGTPSVLTGAGNNDIAGFRIRIRSGNGLMDAAGNEVKDHSTWPGTVTDGVAPFIMSAVAQTGSQNITVRLSEKATGPAGADLLSSDFTYVNVYATEAADSLTFSSHADSIEVVDADSLIYILTVSDDITLSHAMVDSITVTTVQDKALVPNVGVAKNVTILDAALPTVVSANTMDVNSDGMIDNIRIVFSEAINSKNIDNYQSTSDEAIIRASKGVWTANGYKILGVNLTVDQDGADVASFSVGETVYIVNDEAQDDEIIYLALKQSGVPDTDTTLVLSMVGGSAASGGAGIGDFTPNYITIDSLVVEDGAGPAIFDAWMMSETTMSVNLSEPAVDPTYVGTLNFAWVVGNQTIDYVDKGWILNIKQTSPGVLTFNVQNGTNVPTGILSTLQILTADLFEDASGNKNAGAGPEIDVLPFIDVAVEEDNLPDAFALSKNFPNPFNPTTTIEYAIPADGAGHVEMVIYNINGQKVRTLVNETQDAGFYNVVWDGRSDSGEMVSSGLYLYKIVAGSFTKQEKMTFMK